MGSRKTQEQCLTDFRDVWGDRYSYHLVRYNGSNTKVTIVCKTHGEFSQLPNNHLAGYGCPKCAHDDMRSNAMDFIVKARKVHTCYDYSLVEYKNSYTKVKIICKEHGVFEQSPNAHLDGHGCPKCKTFQKPSNLKEFVEKANVLHNNKYLYHDVVYKNAMTKVRIVCKDHGVFEQTPNSHLGGHGCPECANLSKSGSMQEFVEKAKLKHFDKYDYSLVNYKNSSVLVDILCPEHGVFKQRPSSHTKGHGCRKCAKSGFNFRKPASLYVVAMNTDVESYIGFGISQTPKDRLKTHKRNAERKGFSFTLLHLLNFDSGEEAFSLELKLKQRLQIVDSNIIGFKTESILGSNYDKLIAILKENETLFHDPR